MQRFLIAGFGFMGSTHAQALARIRGTKLTAIVDAFPERAAAVARKIGTAAPIFSDLEEALEKAPVDAVDICLPVALHERFIRQSLARGKHVICEKPLAPSPREAAAIAAAVERSGLIFLVAQCLRFWPEYQALERLVRGGSLGRLLSLSMQRRGPRLTPAKLGEMSRNGPGFDTHLHDTDFLHHLFGPPVAVTSSGLRNARGGCDYTFSLFHYPGLSAVAEGGHSYPVGWAFRAGFQAVFEKGAVEYDSLGRPTLTWARPGKPKRPLPFRRPGLGRSRSPLGGGSELDGYYNELSYFTDCLRRGVPPKIATAAQAAQSLRTVAAELESARTGRTVRL